MRRTLRVVLATAAATAIGVLGFAGAADAHVTINPKQAAPGGYARVAFRVPTESDTASTTKLDVYLPTDHPVTSVSLMPVPGWTGTLIKGTLPTPVTDSHGNKITEAVTQITWQADSADTAIKPGQFQEFPVSLGPLPKVDQLVFKAIQTYSDGSVVRWIDLAAPGQDEPAHPAPVLTLTAAGDTQGTSGTASSAPTVVAAGGSGDGGSSTPALIVGIVGAVLGLVGIVLGGLALARGRQRPSTS